MYIPALMHAFDMQALFSGAVVDLFARRILKTITTAKSNTENTVTPTKACLLLKRKKLRFIKSSFLLKKKLIYLVIFQI